MPARMAGLIRYLLKSSVIASLLGVVFSVSIMAQGPNVETGGPPGAALRSRLMSRPLGDSGISSFADNPASQESPLGGRAGPSVSRAPVGVFNPPTRTTRPSQMEAKLKPPPVLEPDTVPRYGDLALPGGIGEKEPTAENAITLDVAMDLLVQNNLYLIALRHEIPLADADILTSSLRANPIFYADTQMVPYGHYARQNPGGPTQYDVNVTLPIDVSQKRKARMAVAQRAKLVTEAQLQDSVRLLIDNLYTSFVDLAAAQETKRFSQSYLDGLNKLYSLNDELYKKGQVNQSTVDTLKAQRELARFQVREANHAVLRTSRVLAQALNLPREQSTTLQLDDELRDTTDLPYQEEALVQMAMQNRPDLTAYRLGISRAEADIHLAEREKYSDVYLLAQPYTLQDNRAYALKSPYSWAVGLTVPLPIFNRNQGNIARTKINLDQTRVEYASVERQIADQVAESVQEFQLSLDGVRELENEILPASARVREAALKQFQGGATNAIEYLEVQRQYNEVVRQYRDALVRHRRSMLDLNSAVGMRVLR